MAADKHLSYRFGFVMEQNLGHRTHYRNLLRYVREDPHVAATWMPIEFETDDIVSRLPLVRSNWSVRASILAQREIHRVRREKPLDTLFYHTQVTSLLSPWQRNIPVVVSLDATPINYDSVGAFYNHDAGGPLERAKFALNRRAFQHAAALVSWCQWAKDSLVNDYGVSAEKISVIAPGVDLAQWPRRRGIERVLASEGRLPRLLFVGGDFERKGGDILLECFRRYLQDDCELTIVTQAPVTPGYHLRVYNSLTPNSETLLQLYAEADIFVFPSLADCAPLAVPEAMAAALPVVTTRIGAIPEMVYDGEQGLLVEPENIESLRIALQTLMASPRMRARMGDAGRARVEQDYDAGHNAQRLLDVLKGVADRAHWLPNPAARVAVGGRR